MVSVMALIRARRISLGLSQRDLANITSVAQPTIAAYESGSREPGIGNVERLAQGVGQRLGFLPMVDVESIVAAHPTMRRSELLSLVLAYQVALELLLDSERVIEKAREQLVVLRAKHRLATSWLDAWTELLNGPGEKLIAALLDPSTEAADLRQSAPFAGVVDQSVRDIILTRLRNSRRAVRHAS